MEDRFGKLQIVFARCYDDDFFVPSASVVIRNEWAGELSPLLDKANALALVQSFVSTVKRHVFRKQPAEEPHETDADDDDEAVLAVVEQTLTRLEQERDAWHTILVKAKERVEHERKEIASWR